jgi:hypothetical protein
MLTLPHQREKRPSTGPEVLLGQSDGQVVFVSPPLQAPSPHQVLGGQVPQS